MNNNVIDEYYFSGRWIEAKREESEEYIKAKEELRYLEELLKENAGTEYFHDIFRKYRRQNDILIYYNNRDAFHAGFKTGARLMMDIANNNIQ